MKPIILYHFPPSAPSRAALLAARMINVPIEISEINLFEKKQLNEEFCVINPQHCVPTINDGGFVLWESRAILSYLANKYGNNDSIYPKDPAKRAIVEQRLYFDIGTLYPKIRAIAFPVLFLGERKISDQKRDDLNNAIELLETFLVNDWVAGEHVTLADLSIVASLTSILAVGWNITKFPRIQEWLKRCEEKLPGYEENLKGAEVFGNAVKSKLAEPVK